jgi:hypothetical protein
LAEELELEGLDALAALAVVAVNPDVHQLSRVVLVLEEAHFTYSLSRPKELDQSSGGAKLQFVVFRCDFDRRMENVDAPASSEKGNVPKLARYNRVVDELAFVLGRELRSQGVLYREAIFASLEEG